MSTKKKSPIDSLTELGTSFWYDNIERRLLENGEIASMINERDILGITSNPSIFNNAITKSSDYDTGLIPMAWAGYTSVQIYEQLAVEDIRTVADLFFPLYQQSKGLDGYVSLEVSPTLAYDTDNTLADAKRLWQWVDRPNLMIKIPATKQGLPAIRQAIAAGINVNVTLIFSRQRYKEVMEMYLCGLEDRVAPSIEINTIASVASFFISRVDTKVDKALEAIGSPHALALRGKCAIANAKLAFQDFIEVFTSERFLRLKAKGAQFQRPLWASTSTKNPQYKDTIYVDNLIGEHIVNTAPPVTYLAFKDHGVAQLTIEEGLPEAKKVIEEVESLGISFSQSTQALEDEGVEAFSQAYRDLLASIEGRAQQSQRQLGSLSDNVVRSVASLEKEHFVSRLFQKDATLWTTDKAGQKEVRNRLGWLDVSLEQSQDIIQQAKDVLADLKRDGYTHALLLGMGGSSLGAEVMRLIAGEQAKQGLDLTILDSTHPLQVKEAHQRSDIRKTVYIVSSKSGGTAEINAFLDYFWAEVKVECHDKAGEHFIAITDKGTTLEEVAKQKGFRKIFFANSQVGGRYSVLIAFGLVPLILMGLDAEKMLKKTAWISAQCVPQMTLQRNPALLLGVVLGEAALAGRDKLTLLADKKLCAFGGWLEQLVAESSGKNGKGIIPIDGEPLLAAGLYQNDRIFIYFRCDGELDVVVQRIIAKGHPVLVFPIHDVYDLGAEFYRWEYATAVACSLLGVDAFDQPDVQDSKIRTKKAIQQYLDKGSLSEDAPLYEHEGVRYYSPTLTLHQFLNDNQDGDYIAINAFLPRDEERVRLLRQLRLFVQKFTFKPTTVGFGPRFLHSTGQLHKGGGDNGIFLQITADTDLYLPIPEQGFTFDVLEKAQAMGDYDALRSRKKRLMRVHLPSLLSLKKWIEDVESYST